MPTLKDIKAQIKALPHKYIFYTKREINYLPEILTDDERIMALTSGYHGNKTVLLVCTNRRLLFIDKGMFFGLKVKQLNLDRIQSLDSSYIILFGTIRIWDGAAAYEISMIFKDSIDPFIKSTRAAIDDYRKVVFRDMTGTQYPVQPPMPRPAPPAGDLSVTSPELLDHLERLARLRESGHLSEAEFEMQKKKLLN